MKAKKITVFVSEELLDKATQATGQGITDTVKKGLLLVATSSVYSELRKLRGKVKFSIHLKELRED